MTLTAYLSLLSLGSSIQLRSNDDEDEQEEQIARLQRREKEMLQAQRSVISAISQHSTSSDMREFTENLAGGVLTVSSMVSNYTLCFPVVVARHRLQAFPARRAWRRDTPVYFARRFWGTYQRQGLGRLYTGFGLGLLAQAITTIYDAMLSGVIGLLSQDPDMPWTRQLFLTAANTCLGWGVHIPLYPLYRNALIVRVQLAGTHQPIKGIKDFALSYKHDLKRFLSPLSGPLPLISVFLPSCLLHVVTEKLLLFLYKRILPIATSSPNHHRHKSSTRSSNRTHQRVARSRRQAAIIETDSGTRIATTGGSNFMVVPEPGSEMERQILTRQQQQQQQQHRHHNQAEMTVLRTFYPEVVCGIVSSLIVRIVSYPLDTVLFRLMLQDSGIQPNQTHYTGFFNCVRHIWYNEGGWRAFFPGWGGGVMEIVMSYLVLEGSWLAYRFVDWKIQGYPEYEPRSVRKVRDIRERMGLPV